MIEGINEAVVILLVVEVELVVEEVLGEKRKWTRRSKKKGIKYFCEEKTCFESILSESVVMHNTLFCISLYYSIDIDVVVWKEKTIDLYVMIVMLVCV